MVTPASRSRFPFVPLIVGCAVVGVLLISVLSPMPRPAETVVAQATVAATYPQGREPMVYPAGYRDSLVHYLTVDRGDGITRNVFISPEAVTAAGHGERIPDGTQVVIEAFDAQQDANGRVLLSDLRRLLPGDLRVDEIHVAERRSTWRIEDTHANTSFDGWNFAAFNADTSERSAARLNDCFSCHDQAFRSEFLFTRDQLDAYARTGEVQYFYCSQPARVPCRLSVNQRQSSMTDSGA
ncbi:MAG: cytochrome P460 family protein [Anaerolineae bacterium]